MSLSVKQFWWAQKFSQYHFRIDYQQNIVNGAANAPSQFSPRDNEKETSL